MLNQRPPSGGFLLGAFLHLVKTLDVKQQNLGVFTGFVGFCLGSRKTTGQLGLMAATECPVVLR
jgi:hypothetical protein